jgi:hypothetical protein
VPETPLQAVLRALDALDLDAAVALFAPEGSLETLFGQRAEGRDRVRAMLGTFFAGLRATHRELTSEWNPEPDVWVGELSAAYELSDRSRRGPYRRALVLRCGEEGFQEMRLYGAHELPLSESGRAFAEVRGADGWMPTL